MQACEGIYIEDTQGRRYMDFHGNNVHQAGFANPDVIEAVKRSLMFTFENFGVIPDMVVIGKGLSGSVFPLAALIVREELDVAGDRDSRERASDEAEAVMYAALTRGNRSLPPERNGFPLYMIAPCVSL